MTIKNLSQELLIWILLSEAMLIVSTRLGAFLHEFVGHGLAALLFGGRFEAFSLTLFAGGEARFSGDFSEIGRLLVYLGGMAVNLVTGLAALWLIGKYRSSFSFTLFGLVFAGASVLSQLQYLILGSYYRHGDPVCLTPYPAAMDLAWVGGLLALALSSLYLMRRFFLFQHAYFPVSSLFTRAMLSLLTLGVPIGLYAGLYHWAKPSLVSTAAVVESRSRIAQEAERIKTETGSEQSVAEIAEKLTPHPIMPWILATYVLTTVVAFFSPARPVKGKAPPLFPSSFVRTFPWLMTAGVSLGFIALMW
jgi:hypothetical protein